MELNIWRNICRRNTWMDDQLFEERKELNLVFLVPKVECSVCWKRTSIAHFWGRSDRKRGRWTASNSRKGSGNTEFTIETHNGDKCSLETHSDTFTVNIRNTLLRKVYIESNVPQLREICKKEGEPHPAWRRANAAKESLKCFCATVSFRPSHFLRLCNQTKAGEWQMFWLKGKLYS